MNRLMALGLRQMFGGMRRGQTPLAALGAAMSVVGWLRQRSGPKRELIYAKNLKEGQALKIRLVRGETVVDETEVRG